MTTRYLLVPAADRALLRAVLRRLDEVLGFPRTLAESEIVRSGEASQHAPAPYTEAAFGVWLHDNTGATVLHGAIAVCINDIGDTLRERQITHGGTRKKLRQWIADQGWEIRTDLPGAITAWTQIAPRDGEPGSSTGVPIPPDPDEIEAGALRAGGGR